MPSMGDCAAASMSLTTPLSNSRLQRLGRGRRDHATVQPCRLNFIPAGGSSRRTPESPAQRTVDSHEITGLETNGLALQGFRPARDVDGVHRRTTAAATDAGTR